MTKIKRTCQSKYRILMNNIGEGGNAVVHKIADCKNNIYAIKELRTEFSNKEKKGRFLDEIKIMLKHNDLDSIISVIDFSYDEFWYVMPMAEPITTAFNVQKFKNFIDIQNLLIAISSALCSIHSRNLVHRDIKPDNIYILNDKVLFGDFGLVDFPNNQNDFTKSDRGIGAIFTIAPEMKRNPKNADGKKADIYSLAKTIWILLTGESKGFDGQYLPTGDYSLRNFEHLKKYHLVELENLLYQATSFNPNDRPNIEYFSSELKNWKDISLDFERYQISEWDFIKRCLFVKKVPDTAIWSENEAIIDVLNVISSLPVFSHMLFSDGGGLDFKIAVKAHEKNFIQIIDEFGSVYILKPKKLYFERFNDPSWNYFLLVIDKTAPIIGNDNVYRNQEVLVEDKPGHYVSALYAQYGVYDYDSGEKLPNGARKVFRYIDGALLFVMKNGFYNGISATYDGRHVNYQPDEFRKCIETLCKLTEICKQNGGSVKSIKSFLNNNPYTKNIFEAYLTGIVDTKISDNRQPITYNQLKGDDFIKNHLMDWSFSDITNKMKSANINDVKAIYYIEYNENTIRFLGDEKNMMISPLYLCCDGTFKRDKDGEIYYFGSEELANSAFSKCKQIILNECIKNGIDEWDFIYPRIRILKGKIKPTNLFTEEEIKDLMEKADDRVANRLVIDADGFARIISGNLINIEYPVRLEIWEAGKVYVGKYSDLAASKDSYMCALNGWLLYLKTGISQYCDIALENNKSKLIEENKKYY